VSQESWRPCFFHPKALNSLLTSTPVVVLAIAGIWRLRHHHRLLVPLSFIFFLLQLYTNSITRGWILFAQGNHYFMRRFDSCFPLFILGLAALAHHALPWLKRECKTINRPLIVFITLLFCLDGWMMSHVFHIWSLNPFEPVNSFWLHLQNFNLLFIHPFQALALQKVGDHLLRNPEPILALSIFWAFAYYLFKQREQNIKPDSASKYKETLPNTQIGDRCKGWIKEHAYWIISLLLVAYTLLWSAYFWHIGPVRPA